ncbi:DTW domain-containing protein [Shewanella sairae]|uniref:tRNA-uridine aminocarboxypropyltransferase n=1 Tax=Shewanella sairae TaxID=190310 RepID=A0ABQ4PAX6_9GAMM|nr:tRNA-uridine aminocarboxypropyltransferase [Shewanella sairae]MCL1130187.1 DTW domain-containing protein [Shewanella sairae]GIU44693.1 DTW domain-containing protein [Shewanella sairae]
MHVILLTHEREATRQTNTGTIALNCLPEHCERIMWSRVSPSQKLLDKLAEPQTALLFPSDGKAMLKSNVDSDETADEEGSADNRNISPAVLPTTLVILDATWQEARKMLRQSPYLKTARTFSLDNTPSSQFNLRRNQVEGGLCTLECIIELFKRADMLSEANLLTEQFIDFCKLSVDE